MIEDPIVNEVRAGRQEYAAKFNYDVALKVRLTPKSGDFGVSASISYGTRVKCDTAQQVVSAQGEQGATDAHSTLHPTSRRR